MIHSKHNFAIRRIKRFYALTDCVWIIHCNCEIEALLTAELVVIVKVVLYDSLDDINIFLAFKNADFVPCKGDHAYEKKNAAEGTHFRGKGISTFIYV